MQSDLDFQLIEHQEPYKQWVSENFPLLASSEHEIVVQEMDRLVKLASLQTDQSAIARQLLGHLVILHGGSPIGMEPHYIARVAASALMRLSYEEDFRDEIFPCLRLALAYCPMLPADLRLIVLDGLDALAHDKYWRDSHLRELGDVLLRALRLEFERQPSERDDRYQMRLLYLMKLAGNTDAEPLFDAIADSSDNEEVKQLARRISRHVLYSLENVWAETPEDQVSSVANRASRLAAARELDFTESEIVQCIFSQMKGADILDASDPRVPPLEAAMKTKSPRIRLAAAFGFALCLRSPVMFLEAALAIETLAGFTVNCDKPTDASDALFALKRARSASPEIATVVDAAKRKASERFAGQSLHE